MIYERSVKLFCCEDISKIENYEKAVNSPESWHCHHRLETHNSDGERRLVDISRKELIALDRYWHRPASELIFLTSAEHKRLHLKGKPAWNKGQPAWNKGKHRSEETKRKISEAMKGKLKGRPSPNKGKPAWNKGKQLSEEYKAKMSAALKGKSAWNKGKHCKLVDEKRVWY